MTDLTESQQTVTVATVLQSEGARANVSVEWENYSLPWGGEESRRGQMMVPQDQNERKCAH